MSARCVGVVLHGFISQRLVHLRRNNARQKVPIAKPRSRSLSCSVSTRRSSTPPYREVSLSFNYTPAAIVISRVCYTFRRIGQWKVSIGEPR
ncbi:hypothetical protein EVAR_96269_1 [Eumeta japonica]|uniref:Uncharacterized protein n=1 Tax=Eumeta variegata TaxID=151549 RepID=A0A4C1WJX3_EUMVA|nr:hypothetical protein EVAR_96269_1 [Eumeta japonica]